MFRYEFEEAALILLERAAQELQDLQDAADVTDDRNNALAMEISDFLERVESEGIQFN